MDGLGAAAGIRGGIADTLRSYAGRRPLDRKALQFYRIVPTPGRNVRNNLGKFCGNARRDCPAAIGLE